MDVIFTHYNLHEGNRMKCISDKNAGFYHVVKQTNRLNLLGLICLCVYYFTTKQHRPRWTPLNVFVLKSITHYKRSTSRMAAAKQNSPPVIITDNIAVYEIVINHYYSNVREKDIIRH